MKKLLIILMVLLLSFSMVACSSEGTSDKAVAEKEVEQEVEPIEPTEPPTPEYVTSYEQDTASDESGEDYPTCVSNAAQSFICASKYCMDVGYVVPTSDIMYARDDFYYEGMFDECWEDYAEWLYDCEIAPAGEYENTEYSWDPSNYVTDYSIGELNKEEQSFTGKVTVKFQVNEASEDLVARTRDLPYIEVVTFEYKMIYTDGRYELQYIKYLPDESSHV